MHMLAVCQVTLCLGHCRENYNGVCQGLHHTAVQMAPASAFPTSGLPDTIYSCALPCVYFSIGPWRVPQWHSSSRPPETSIACKQPAGVCWVTHPRIYGCQGPLRRCWYGLHFTGCGAQVAQGVGTALQGMSAWSHGCGRAAINMCVGWWPYGGVNHCVLWLCCYAWRLCSTQ